MNISNNSFDFNSFKSIEEKSNKDNFSTLDIISVDSGNQIADESIVDLINMNEDYSLNSQYQTYNSIKIGEWKPLNLNYLL